MLISSKKKNKAGQGNKYYFSELGGSLGVLNRAVTRSSLWFNRVTLAFMEKMRCRGTGIETDRHMRKVFNTPGKR